MELVRTHAVYSPQMYLMAAATLAVVAAALAFLFASRADMPGSKRRNALLFLSVFAPLLVVLLNVRELHLGIDPGFGFGSFRLLHMAAVALPLVAIAAAAALGRMRRAR